MKLNVMLVSFICILCSTALADESLTTRDFAYGYAIKVDGELPVYSLTLPETVYRTARDKNLGDIRVFNGFGKSIPYTLRLPKENESVKNVGIEVPFFPLYEDAKVNSDTMSLKVKRSNDGTIIDIDSNDNAHQGERHVTGYILDLGDEFKNAGILELFWQKDDKNSSVNVHLEQTSDFQRWQRASASTALIDLEYNGNRIQQRSIELQMVTKRYLRLSFEGQGHELVLERVRAYKKAQLMASDFRWSSIYTNEQGLVQDGSALQFTSRYNLPTRSIQLQFAEPNSIVDGVVYSRTDSESPWQKRCEGLFYSLKVDDQMIENEPCFFSITKDKQWQLKIRNDGAGVTDNHESVTMQLGWQSYELLFLARGEGPFILAYGSGRLVNSERVSQSDMVGLTLGSLTGEEVVQQAHLGKKIVLGGDAALRIAPPPKPWKTWLLWAILIVGVLLMGVMAARLIKDMKSEG